MTLDEMQKEKKVMTKREFMKYVRVREQEEREMEEKERLFSIVGSGYDEFWYSKARYRVVKGGRGSKKSTTTALWFIYNIMQYPLANAVCVRRTFNTHKDSTFAQLKWAAQQLGVYDDWVFTVNPLQATYKPTGQVILFRGFDEILKLTSITVPKGHLCWCWMEEVFEIESESDFDTLDESIRGVLPDGLWKSITLSFNPWLMNHWTKARFFDKEHPNAFTLTTTYKCNEFLDQADIDKIEELQHSNPDRFKVVGLGEYGMPGGAYFEEFRSDVHAVNGFQIPKEWARFRTVDYGLDMLACYWIAMDPQSNMYVYKELYENGLIISDAAKRILSRSSDLEENIITSAPPDLWNRRQETGKSAADIFIENGVYLIKSSNKRVQGWYNVKEWLKVFDTVDEQTGEKKLDSKLKIFKNCHNLIRCLPQAQKADNDPNDVSDTPHEVTHSLDSIRYFISSKPYPNNANITIDDEDDEDDVSYNGNVFFS